MTDFAENYKTVTGKPFFLGQFYSQSKQDNLVEWQSWESAGIPTDAQIERMAKKLSFASYDGQIVIKAKPKIALGL